MIGLLLRLLLAVAIIYLLLHYVRKRIAGVAGSASRTVPFAAREQCPSCRQAIRVGNEPGQCPKCGINLGRTPDGDLLIRIN